MKTDRTRLAIFAGLGVYTLWGFTFLASRIAQNYVTPFALLAFRFDIAALLLAIPLLIGRQKVTLKGKHIMRLLIPGLMEPCLYFIGEQYGIRYTNSAFSGVMIAIIPIVTLLFAGFLLHERPSPAQWAFSVLSILGIIVITLLENKGGSISLRGVLCLVMAVVTGSLYTILSRKISNEFTVYERTLLTQIIGGVFYTLLMLLQYRTNLASLLASFVYQDFVFAILYLAVFGSVIGYTLFNYSVANAPTAKVVVLCNLTTILSVLAGVLILGESFSPFSAVAMVVVLIGIIGVQKS